MSFLDSPTGLPPPPWRRTIQALSGQYLNISPTFDPLMVHGGGPHYRPEDFDGLRRSFELLRPHAKEAIMIPAEIDLVIKALSIAAAVAGIAQSVQLNLIREMDK